MKKKIVRRLGQKDAAMKKSKTPFEKHKDHEMEVVDGPFGIHAGKLMCKECGKWVMWLPNNYKEKLNE